MLNWTFYDISFCAMFLTYLLKFFVYFMKKWLVLVFTGKLNELSVFRIFIVLETVICIKNSFTDVTGAAFQKLFSVCSAFRVPITNWNLFFLIVIPKLDAF